MNRIYYVIGVLLLLCSGCREEEASYVITGHIDNPVADGNILYLSHSNGDELINLDSVIVDGGKFTFQGVQEEPIMAYLRFKSGLDSLSVPATFILENDELVAEMNPRFSTVKGALQNLEVDAYRQEMYLLDSLRQRLHQRYVAQVTAGKMDSLTEQAMYNEDVELNERRERLAYRFIRKNSHSPAALWVLETMQPCFTEDELMSLVSGFKNENKESALVAEIGARLRQANRIGEGSPYIDLPLLEYHGRKRNLSDYVGYTRYVAVAFWQTDSEPACRDMKKFVDLYRKYNRRGASFLAIALDSVATEWRVHSADWRYISHQCKALDRDEVITKYALLTIPHFILIAPDGTIAARNLTVEQLDARLHELLPLRMVKELPEKNNSL